MNIVTNFEIKETTVQLDPECGPSEQHLQYLYFDKILISKAANLIDWSESPICTGFCSVCGNVLCGSDIDDTLLIKRAAPFIVFCPSIWLGDDKRSLLSREATHHEVSFVTMDLYQTLSLHFSTMPNINDPIPALTYIDLLRLIQTETYVNNQPVFFINHDNAIEIYWDFILCTTTDDKWAFNLLKQTLESIFLAKPQPLTLTEVSVSETECFSPVFYIGEEITQCIEWSPLCVIENRVFLQLTEGLLAGPFLTTDSVP